LHDRYTIDDPGEECQRYAREGNGVLYDEGQTLVEPLCRRI